MEFFAAFMPHGHCYLWTPSILWTMVASDALIALSYFSIPVSLLYFTRKREDLPFGWMFVLFGVFILACGTGHAFEVWNTWNGDYGAESIVKAVTALASIGTAVALWPLLPRALVLPSPGQLREANQALQREVDTRRAAEDALREQARELSIARDAAEAANRAKSQFLANVSHEIRTPLNSVIGLTEVLLGGELSEQQRDHLRTVQDSGDALLRIVDDILDFSKIEAGRTELESISFDLEDAVGDALRSLAVRAGRKHLELLLRIEERVPRRLRGDPARLRQVITNLVANAITYTEAGEVEVRIDCATAGDPTQLRFEVRDTGMGIAPEKLERLFDPFVQGDASTTRRFGGTGLGLSICRGLVELMGGRIGVESEPGRGSTFTFTARFGPGDPPLPDPARGEALGIAARMTKPIEEHELARTVGQVIAGSDEAPAAIRGGAAETGVADDPSVPALRILLVEDSVANQKVVLAMLRGGHEVEIARDGAEAARIFAGGGFDLVLMDIQMPVMDGYASAAAIRAAERETGGHVPIVAMTAHALPGDRERCLAAGMDDYLSKPIRRADLLRVLSSVRRDSRSTGDPPA